MHVDIIISMKKLLFTLFILVAAKFSFASGLFFDSFEYVNHDLLRLYSSNHKKHIDQ